MGVPLTITRKRRLELAHGGNEFGLSCYKGMGRSRCEKCDSLLKECGSLASLSSRYNKLKNDREKILKYL